MKIYHDPEFELIRLQASVIVTSGEENDEGEILPFGVSDPTVGAGE